MSTEYSCYIIYGYALQQYKKPVELKRYNQVTGEPYYLKGDELVSYIKDKEIGTIPIEWWNNGFVHTAFPGEGTSIILGIELAEIEAGNILVIKDSCFKHEDTEHIIKFMKQYGYDIDENDLKLYVQFRVS